MPYFILKASAFEKKLVNNPLFRPSHFHKDQDSSEENQEFLLPRVAANISSKRRESPIPNFLASGPLLHSGNLEITRRQLGKNSKPPYHSRLSYTYNWLLEELSFSMNKISLAGLIIGLMVLGSLFFAIGFLAAIATFGTGNTTSPTTWASANSQQQNHPSAIGKFAEAVGGKLIHDEAIKLESKLGGGALSKMVNRVPPSLQPFAAQAQNQLAIKSQQQIGGLPGAAQGAFASHTFGSAQRAPYPERNPNYQPQSGGTQLPSRQTPPVFAPQQQHHLQQAPQPQYYHPYPGQQQAIPQQPTLPPQQQQNYQPMQQQQNYQPMQQQRGYR